MQRSETELVCLSETPRLFQQEAFITEPEIEHVLARYGTREALDALGLAWEKDFTGLFSELPLDADPVLLSLARRIETLLGFRCELKSATFRFRRYSAGTSHPPHVDAYRIASLRLVATAILYLTDVEEGGETFFPEALPTPITIQPRKGRLALWYNYKPDGATDSASIHESIVVGRGEKATLAYFVYAPIEAAKTTLLGRKSEPLQLRATEGRKFVCIVDDTPETTTTVLREACEARGVAYEEVETRDFDFVCPKPLAPGTMMYRPAVSVCASRVEQALWGPQVATLYQDREGPFTEFGPEIVLLERRGLPVPRFVWAPTANRAKLRKAVDYLGGLPIVVKVMGGQAGVGVIVADTFAGLFSLMDHLRATGRIPLLLEYIPDATHWRCVVVGSEVVAAYRNPKRENDFRTFGSDDPADYQDKPSEAIVKSAIAATQAMRVELGGVDVLEHPSGRHYLLEVNFPCYFARGRLVGGYDVGGAIVDWLLKKASRLVDESEQAIEEPSRSSSRGLLGP